MPLNQLDSDILNYIISENLQTGDRLPSLAELSEILDISIGKLREQLEVARTLDMVGVKPRAGIQIQEFNFASTLRVGLLYGLAKSEKNFDAFKSLRNETTAAFWCEAVAALSSDDLAGLRALLGAAWGKLNRQQIVIPHEEHRSFHLSLFRRLDNPFVIGIEESYWCAYEAVELNRYVDYQYLRTVWNYHEKMVDLIADEQYEASRGAFVEHTKLLGYGPGQSEMSDGRFD